MHHINTTINSRKRFFRAPSSWNELSKTQLLIWCGIIRQNISIEMAKKAASVLIYNLPATLYDRLNLVQQSELNQTLDFLFNTNSLTKNVIGSFRLLGFKYTGPSNRLANLTIAEYRRTELYYQLYDRTDDPFFLNLLAAALFTRGKNNTDKAISRRAQFFRLANPNLLHAILLFYEGCREYIHKSFPKIFVKSNPNNQQRTTNNEIQDFEDIILAVAGSKFGNFKDTNDVNLYTFLKHLTLEMERVKK